MWSLPLRSTGKRLTYQRQMIHQKSNMSYISTPNDSDLISATSIEIESLGGQGPLSFICVAHDLALPFPDFTRGEAMHLTNSGGAVAAKRLEAEVVGENSINGSLDRAQDKC
jgi:hypothetical protein